MTHRRRRPDTTSPADTSPAPRHNHDGHTPPRHLLWRAASRRAVLSLASSAGTAAIGLLNWWIQHR